MTIRTVEIPFLAIVREKDPDFDRARRRELTYDFQGGLNGRRFYLNPMNSGAYGDTRQFLTDENGNVIVDENGFGVLLG